MDWLIERLNHTNPTLDYQDLSNYKDDFRKLSDLKIIKHSQTLESLPCEWCEREHPLSPFRNSKDEIVLSCSGGRRVINPDELKIWTINRDALIENIKSKNPIIDKKIFEQTTFGINRPKLKTISTKILIKDARLDEQNYLLEINNGGKVISFKSKKKGSGLEKETKQFKVLYHLWDFRWELKNGRVLKKGDYTSLDNLVKGSGSKSIGAAYKHIQRLNNRLKNEGVTIEIEGENEKYRLIINKA